MVSSQLTTKIAFLQLQPTKIGLCEALHEQTAGPAPDMAGLNANANSGAQSTKHCHWRSGTKLATRDGKDVQLEHG